MQTQEIGPGKGLEAIGGAVEKSSNYLYQKMDEARNYSEASQAKLKMVKGMSELMIKADTDVDPSTGKLRTGKKADYESYDNALRTMREDVAKTFTNKDVGQRFLADDYDLSALTTRNKIQNTFTKNMINEGQATTIETTYNLANTYAATGDETLLKQIDSTLTEATNKGLFSADVAYNKKLDMLNMAKYNRFLTEYRADPVSTTEKVKTNGFKMDVETLHRAEGQLKYLKNEVVEQQHNNAYGLWEKLQAGTLTVDEILSRRDSKGADGITLPDAKNLETSLYERMNKQVKTLYESNDRAREYIDVVSKIENNRDKYSRFQTILSSFANGELSKEESVQLNNLTGKQDATFDVVKSGISAIKNWASYVPSLPFRVLAPALNNYFNRVANGESPQEAAKKEIETATIIHNPNKLKYEIGQIITNPKTRKSAKVTGFREDGTPTLQAQ